MARAHIGFKMRVTSMVYIPNAFTIFSCGVPLLSVTMGLISEGGRRHEFEYPMAGPCCSSVSSLFLLLVDVVVVVVVVVVESEEDDEEDNVMDNWVDAQGVGQVYTAAADDDDDL
jgi:hypothetical protein